MNLNNLAKEICAIEGGKKNLDISQVKEVLRIICVLAYDDKSLIIDLWRAGAKKSIKKKAKK